MLNCSTKIISACFSSIKSILESSYVTPKIFGVELAMYANFWHISKGFCLTGVGWRGVNLKHSKIIWFNVLLKKIPKERYQVSYFWLSEMNLSAPGTTRVTSHFKNSEMKCMLSASDLKNCGALWLEPCSLEGIFSRVFCSCISRIF